MNKKEINKESIRTRISPDEVYSHWKEHQEELEYKMDVIAENDTDDFNKKSFLYVTTESGQCFLSLESPDDTIVTSEYVSASTAKEAVERFLGRLVELGQMEEQQQESEQAIELE